MKVRIIGQAFTFVQYSNSCLILDIFVYQDLPNLNVTIIILVRDFRKMNGDFRRQFCHI